MPKLKRSRQTAPTSMRLTREAITKLDRRARALGVSKTAVVEMLIREAPWIATTMQAARGNVTTDYRGNP